MALFNNGLLLQWLGFGSNINNNNCIYTYPIAFTSWFKAAGLAYGSYFENTYTGCNLTKFYAAVVGGNKQRDVIVIGV